MKLAIMQPYLFPYIGYWQLINVVDTFVVYDDVNYIKKGFINRNSILSNGKAQLFTLELIGASQNKLINEIEVGNNKKKILKMIELNYKKAPYFDYIYPLIKQILENDEKKLAKFLIYSLQKIANYLEIKTNFILSSEIEKNNTLKAQDKILEIVEILEASHYINAIGGKELYNKEIFERKGIKLNFLDTQILEYKQFKGDFISNLSIIDILMFNNKNEIKIMLESYKLV